LKDVSHWPYAGDKVQTFQLYESICQEKNSLKMSGEDFVTFIKKNDTIRKNKQRIAKQMLLRYQQVQLFGGVQQASQLNVVDSPRKDYDGTSDQVSLDEHLVSVISQAQAKTSDKQYSRKISYVVSSAPL
jgi:hypothetical protein